MMPNASSISAKVRSPAPETVSSLPASVTWVPSLTKPNTAVATAMPAVSAKANQAKPPIRRPFMGPLCTRSRS